MKTEDNYTILENRLNSYWQIITFPLDLPEMLNLGVLHVSSHSLTTFYVGYKKKKCSFWVSARQNKMMMDLNTGYTWLNCI